MQSNCTEAAIVRACHPKAKAKTKARAKHKDEDDKADKDEWRRVAKQCGVRDTGPFPWGFLAGIGARHSTCVRLFAKDTAPEISVDEQMRFFLDTLTQGKIFRRVRKFRGEMIDCLFAIVYLMQRFPDTCMQLDSVRRAIQEPRLDWSMFSVYWRYSTLLQRYRLHVPESSTHTHTTLTTTTAPTTTTTTTTTAPTTTTFLQEINQCLRQHRFFFSLLVMQSHKPPFTTLHANALCYDKQTGLLERFEPFQGRIEEYATDQLDQELTKYFRRLHGFRRVLVPPPVPAEDRNGLQHRAQNELEREPGDPTQFCLPWSVMYAETRLRFPNQDPDSIPELIRHWAEQHHQSLSVVIRNYTYELEQLKLSTYERVLPQYNPSEPNKRVRTEEIYRAALTVLLDDLDASHTPAALSSVAAKKKSLTSIPDTRPGPHDLTPD